jgi:hydroxyacyl-ACP dehydratase HTD2-like protein with hotdog domain
MPIIELIAGPLKISHGYPARSSDLPDVRNDERIYAALRKAGKLK